MYVSNKWLQEFTDFSYTPDELDHILTMLGIEVESITDYGKKYDNFYIAKVINKEKHLDADKLSVCKVLLNDKEYNVVCGAPNVEEGQTVVLGLAGAVVPNGGFTLEKRKIRGIESNGMICSKQELELGEDHSGIWVLPDDAPQGNPLADYLGMNDVVYEISVTPNRADCLSHLGIAREISAYSGKPLRKPEIRLKESSNNIDKSIEIIIEDIDKCSRYTGKVLRNVSVSESPEWLKNRLIMLGMRPINVIVDVTNYVLLECGQPLHAFDLDRIEEKKIIVKTAYEGEKFITLDSKERILDSSMLMICDGKKNVAIGGVMGGQNSEIDKDTKNILIESAFFSPQSIRRTAKKLNLQSEASYRFERGVDIDNVLYANERAAMLISELTGATLEKGTIDIYPVKQNKPRINLRYQRAAHIIGVEIEKEKIFDMLEKLQCKIIEHDAQQALVEVPLHRIDISLEIDLIEEIARLYNYDNIQPDFSSSIEFSGETVPVHLAVPYLRKQFVDYFVRTGFNQILTQNMISPDSAKLFGDSYVEISNPLGEELSVMRNSMIPSLLKTIEHNIRLGNNNLRLFEIARTFHHADSSNNTFIDGILENEELLIAISGKNNPKQWGVQERNIDFFDIKGIFEDFIKFFKFEGISLKNSSEIDFTIYSPDSLSIYYQDKEIGQIGELSKDLLKKFEIDKQVFLIRLDSSILYRINRKEKKYSQVSPYPGISRDLAFVVDNSIPSSEILDEILKNGDELLKSTEIFDLYSGKSIGDNKKSIAFSLFYSSDDRTLKDEDVEKSINKIIESVESRFQAKLRKS